MTFKWWKLPPVNPMIKVYIYNVTNADAFLNNGEKPMLDELGPFTYLYVYYYYYYYLDALLLLLFAMKVEGEEEELDSKLIRRFFLFACRCLLPRSKRKNFLSLLSFVMEFKTRHFWL